MAAYSLDLRKRVLRAWDSGMDVYSVAAKDAVSRAWVHRLVQRRRETGSIAPRKQTKFRRRSLSPQQEERLVALIRRAAIRPVRRRPTKPKAGARERRLASKKKRGAVKESRSRRSGEDD